MPDPTPQNPIPEGWRPTTSTVAGGAIGGAFAQLAVASIEFLIHQSLTSATAAALTTVCIVVAGYIFPDGGRK